MGGLDLSGSEGDAESTDRRRTSSNGGSIDEGEVFEILRNSRRRWIIRLLREEVGERSLRELAEEIAELETGESPPPRDARDSVYNALHQTHLPKLDERGVVTYDADRKTVALCEGAHDVHLYLEVVTRYGITWGEYYRLLGVLGLSTVVAAELGVSVVAGLGPLVVSSCFLALFALSISYQFWNRRWLYLQRLARHR